MKHHVLLSYSHADTDLMRRVRDALVAAGLAVWTDEALPDDAAPGTPLWEDAMRRAIDEAGCVVVLLSPQAGTSDVVRRMVTHTLVSGHCIFPVLLTGDVEHAVPPALHDTAIIDMRDGNADTMADALSSVVDAVARHLVTMLPLEKPPRSVHVTLPDGQVLTVQAGTRLEAVIKTWQQDANGEPALAALVDGVLRELTIPVQEDCAVTPLTMRSSDGGRMYRRSLVFLLITAAAELFPEAQVVIHHALPTGAYYCELRGRGNFTQAELDRLMGRMREIVAAEEPIRRTRMPLDEARAFFAARGDDDKVRLLDFRYKDYLMVYKLRDSADYFYGYMVPSTGYLNIFDMRLHPPDGFLLMYPRRESPTIIKPYQAANKIAAVFERQAEWLELLGLEDIGHLNQVIVNRRARELVLVAEALHNQHLADIAAEIAERHKAGVRLVLIAGPSSSGKTTFSKRLAIQLLAHGVRPYTLELDHYFVDRDQTPRDENGEYDFEALEALNLPLLNEQLNALMAGEVVHIPYFDFISGKSSRNGKTAQITRDHVLIVEGIHGLNPQLVAAVDEARLYRIYISALTQLNIDRHNRIPTTDVRLLRRIVRDARYRGYTALDTLGRWPSVRRGEKRHIFPYQENADVMFNSSLMYELAVLRPLAEPLLL
ncbi:MAG: TIR domain-containing protein, partial [Anaerolineae bacterium]|nr:TIR domain-containing protein [Anaerolineae bacterium]